MAAVEQETAKPGGAAIDSVSMCCFLVGDGLYGIPTVQVREVLGIAAVQRVPRAPAMLAGVVAYRGDVLTAVSLRRLLGLGNGDGSGCVLVLDEGGGEEPFGLVVDRMGGVETLAACEREANPRALDERSRRLFDCVYRRAEGLLVHLNAGRLRPSSVAEMGIVGMEERG